MKHFIMQLAFLALMMWMPMAGVNSYKRNYEAKYTKPNVPLWKQRVKFYIYNKHIVPFHKPHQQQQ